MQLCSAANQCEAMCFKTSLKIPEKEEYGLDLLLCFEFFSFKIIAKGYYFMSCYFFSQKKTDLVINPEVGIRINYQSHYIQCDECCFPASTFSSSHLTTSIKLKKFSRTLCVRMSGYASLEKESIICQTENILFLFIHPSIIYELPYIHQEPGCMMKEVCIIFKD